MSTNFVSMMERSPVNIYGAHTAETDGNSKNQKLHDELMAAADIYKKEADQQYIKPELSGPLIQSAEGGYAPNPAYDEKAATEFTKYLADRNQQLILTAMKNSGIDTSKIDTSKPLGELGTYAVIGSYPGGNKDPERLLKLTSLGLPGMADAGGRDAVAWAIANGKSNDELVDVWKGYANDHRNTWNEAMTGVIKTGLTALGGMAGGALGAGAVSGVVNHNKDGSFNWNAGVKGAAASYIAPEVGGWAKAETIGALGGAGSDFVANTAAGTAASAIQNDGKVDAKGIIINALANEAGTQTAELGSGISGAASAFTSAALNGGDLSKLGQNFATNYASGTVGGWAKDTSGSDFVGNVAKGAAQTALTGGKDYTQGIVGAALNTGTQFAKTALSNINKSDAGAVYLSDGTRVN